MPIYQLKGNRDFNLEVKGESHYQNNLQVICGPHKPEGVNILVDAFLILEENNPYDRNAVRVDVQGKTVGHLPRKEAQQLRQVYKLTKISSNVILSVKGHIRGGFIRKDGEKGHYGIWLDFPTDISGAQQLKAIAKKSRRSCCLFPFLK